MRDSKKVAEYPILVSEWDYKKNEKTPDDYTYGSKLRVWWICSKCNHSWDAIIRNRTIVGTGCIKCHKLSHSKRQLEKSVKRNSSVYASDQLMAEWDYDKNTLDPKEIPVTYTKKVWWKCTNAHSWDSTPNGRFNRKWECPYCSSHRDRMKFNLHRLKSEKSLADKATSKILSEWDYELNEGNPKDYLSGSNYRASWICSVCSFKWKTFISNRLRKNGTNCPNCFIQNGTSKVEQEFADKVKVHTGLQVLRNDRIMIAPYELDLFIPDLNIAVEFHGNYWHSDEIMLERRGMLSKDYDLMKNKLCKDVGISLLIIWESEWLQNEHVVLSKIDEFISINGRAPYE